MQWEPDTYSRFSGHRDRPFFELTARIEAAEPRSVVDMGCGSGSLTAALAGQWPMARVLGLDSSPEMISEARRKNEVANLRFSAMDAATWVPPDDLDVLVTNAMLQWLPHHLDVVAGWLDALRPGAWFAAQVPGNFAEPSHQVMRSLADSPRWVDRLCDVLGEHDTVAEPGEYLRLLLAAGFEADVWESTYQQVLCGENAVLEWVRGTALRPVKSALDPAAMEDFEREYSRQINTAYPAFRGPAGETLTIFPFRRIFIVGRKVGAAHTPRGAYQPRDRHSSSRGASAPSVVPRPCPG